MMIMLRRVPSQFCTVMLLAITCITGGSTETAAAGDTLVTMTGVDLGEWIRLCQELEGAGLLEDTGRGLRVLARLSKEQSQPRLLVDALLASARLLGRTSGEVRDNTAGPPAGGSRQLRLLNALLEVARICGRGDGDMELQRRAEAALGGKTLAHGITVAACREGYAMREEGRPLAALRVLRGAEAVTKMLPATESARAHLLNDQCNILRGLGELHAARTSCEESVLLKQSVGESSEADHAGIALFRFNLGQVLKDLKDYEGAIQQWLLATEGQQGKDVDTWISLGLAAERLGRSGEGLQFLQRGWEADPGHPFPYIAAASLLFRAGYMQAALPLLQAVRQREDAGAGRHYHDRLAVSPPPHFTFPQHSVLSSPLSTSPPAVPLTPLPPLPARRHTHPSPSDASPSPAPAPALRAAIAYLTSDSEKELGDLAVSLQLLHAHLFAVHTAYPVIIFHDTLSEHHITALRAVAPFTLSFQRVDIAAPPPSTPPSARARILSKYLGYGMGYRGMCRFFSGPIFTHPALSEFEWYMRLDTDSFFLAPLPFDPFVRLHDLGAAYGYLSTGREERKFSVGLWDAFVAAVGAQGMHQPGFTEFIDKSGQWDDTFFYTNFEISRLDPWRSERYVRLMEQLDRSAGFWLHRWGDGPVRVMAVSYFLNASQVVRLPEVPYWHQTLVQRPPPLEARPEA